MQHHVHIAVFLRFNPCCIGLVIATGTPDFNSFRVKKFQSLLYWISHCDRHELIATIVLY
ncbi:hypothetical protein BN874_460113 [Candidatus Contendobacter odensis Run_B_J11]|uniref:Uncharacterized protein n=1 Tax=Candidatus Contendobacter odensis Run_B_J11 TaxID=1400861 RepID=A0A7U7J593_9GAMM|nr:hypothetical protein BN874_460113 [Candidatus Contendobacter odensis Run_B_J11]